jgi:GntR family transcriptional repressor for pyruvate dehydrogenase complex
MNSMKYSLSEAAFYRTIAEASDNEYFIEFIQMIDAKLMENLRSVVVKNAMVAETGAQVRAEHDEVYAAIRDRDVEGARLATRRHYEHAAKRLAERSDIGTA